MTVNLSCMVKPEFHFHYRKLAGEVIAASLRAEHFPCGAEVSLTLADNAFIQEINRSARGIDAPTDVLSFPMLEYAAPADFSAIEEQWADCADPDTGEVMLGDIVISVEKVREQAAAYGHSEKREYAFLITHSMLHLMGYDHMQPEEAAVMEERQRAILDTLKITR
ncbi:MAG: rRNA maturation RNase YbeY [Clostridiales bacterium]|nr:rRNA maturation RNase YbeY [Clostridiales bacterium]